MGSISKLLNPKSIAIVGASPRGGRGGRSLLNLRETGFVGEVFAVNPRYDEVLGVPCFPSLEALPRPVDCALIAIAADAVCQTLETAFAQGIKAAVVLAAGFGEGGQNRDRAEALRRLGERGMSICGPNCYGLLSLRKDAIVAAYSGRLPRPLLPGHVALVSQSGGLTNNAFAPLMSDRRLGFRYIVSCGNQIATSVEDYMEAFVEDPDVQLIAAVVESIKNPSKLLSSARAAHRRGIRMVFHQIGRSEVGREMTRSHTGALVGNAEVASAFLRRCGIVCVDDYDKFVETIELFSVAPNDREASHEAIVISGSGGAAAIIADALDGSCMTLPPFDASMKERIGAVLPDFGAVGNPLDGTGLMSDDPAVLEKVLDIITQTPGQGVIASVVSAKNPSPKEHRFSEIIAKTARSSQRVVVAYQYSPLGGPLDGEIVERLQGAGVPLLLGSAMAMRVLDYLPLAQDLRRQAQARDRRGEAQAAGLSPAGRLSSTDFIGIRKALIASGVEVVDADLAIDEGDALALFQRFAGPVALKAEAKGLLHKSDIGCVRLNCASEAQVTAGFRAVVENARRAGFDDIAGVLVQPMTTGVAEVYAGALNDPIFGPAIVVGLGGVFVEIFKDTATEIAPLSEEEAAQMISRLKAAPILSGARGRPPADVEALARLLARLSRFALANADRYATIDLNPIIVKGKGLGASVVDIAVEPAAGL